MHSRRFVTRNRRLNLSVMRTFLILLLYLSLFFSCRSPDWSPENFVPVQPESIPSIGPGLQFGFCHAGYSRSDKEYALLEELGAKWIRIDLSWHLLEPEPGVWDFSRYDPIITEAHNRGFKVLGILCYDTPWLRERTGDDKRRIHPDYLPDYLNYVRIVADRYRTLIGAFEIWNEPNMKKFWGGTNEEFFSLTRSALKVLEETAPEVPVGVGSILLNPIFSGESFLYAFIDAGCMENADALTLHPYTGYIKTAAQRINDAGLMLKGYGIEAEIWVTEVGFPTKSWHPLHVPLEKQPEYVESSLRSLTEAGANLVMWYRLFSNKERENADKPFGTASFGLVWNEGGEIYEWKPGAFAYRDTVSELRKKSDQ